MEFPDNIKNMLISKQRDQLFNIITKCALSDKSFTPILKEEYRLLINENSPIEKLITGMIDLVSNKYKLTAEKILNQSKEVNDLYTKCDDLLKHDRMARFAHANDKVDIEKKFPIMKDSRNPNIDYRLEISLITYNPEFFIKEIKHIMDYANKESKNKKKNIQELKANLIKMIDDDFEEKHTFVKYFEPLMKVKLYKDQRLESALVHIEEALSAYYKNIGVYNKFTEYQILYLQVLQQAYYRMLAMFRTDKDGKELVDDVFKKIIDNCNMSLDFDSKCMVLYTDAFKYYAKELSALYDIIRS